MNAIIWFRNELRVADNMLLSVASKYENVYPVYCFEEEEFGKVDLGMDKTGAFRAQFIRESIEDLRKSLKELGSNLIVRQGNSVSIIATLAQELNAQAVLASKEVTHEEVIREKQLQVMLPEGSELQLYWQSTLYHLSDLPIEIGELPEVFTNFRKIVEKKSMVRDLVTPTKTLPSIHDINFGEIPSLAQLGLQSVAVDSRTAIQFHGGESAAKERMQHYFWETEKVASYKETRNGLIGSDYSSKFSPWLALGCLSPRTIFHEIKRFENAIKKNSSTYWLIFELIWRDYFRFMALKHGNKLFQKGGILGKYQPSRKHETSFRRWCDGATGVDFVDANMLELKLTGFMSNRGRQNVASFLVNDLNIDWRWGATYFESMLIDYDPCSNWGNWTYVAGVGNDPRQDRYFNITTQAERYDPNGEYVDLWLG